MNGRVIISTHAQKNQILSISSFSIAILSPIIATQLENHSRFLLFYFLLLFRPFRNIFRDDDKTAHCECQRNVNIESFFEGYFYGREIDELLTAAV